MTGTHAEMLLHSAPAGDTGVSIVVTPESAGWRYTGLRVVSLSSDQELALALPGEEAAIVPLSGDATVTVNRTDYRIGGRSSVLAGLPTSLYVALGSAFTIAADDACELAICTSRADRSFPSRLIPSETVEVEIRGSGNAARQINHIVKPDFPADRLLVVEVITPSGNWSSYPPHKHDVSEMPREADLEEICYYRIETPDGFGLQRLYTGDGSIDEAWVIRDRDLLLVPGGYHSFVVAHGYTGYYLNVLAGDESPRTMQPSDDPAHAWVRQTWTADQVSGLTDWRGIEERVNGAAGSRPAED